MYRYNVVAETSFHSLKTEFIHHMTFETRILAKSGYI